MGDLKPTAGAIWTMKFTSDTKPVLQYPELLQRQIEMAMEAYRASFRDRYGQEPGMVAMTILVEAIAPLEEESDD